MKKLSIITISLLTAFSLSGCSTAIVEKEPVAIEDSLDTAKNDNLTENTFDSSTVGQTNQEASEQSITDTAPVTVSPTKESTMSSLAKSSVNSTNADSNMGTSSEAFPMKIGLEGMEETINAKTYFSSLGYEMAYDSDRFTISSENETDSYIAANPDPELYPYVYVTISKVTDTKDNIPSLSNGNLVGISAITRLNDTIIGEYDAQHYKAITGSDWNSIIRNYYIITTDIDSYVIETQYFLEAEEGFGARISAMLHTFKIMQ